MTSQANFEPDVLRCFDEAISLLNGSTPANFESGIQALTDLGAKHHRPGSLKPRFSGSATQFCVNLLCDFLRKARPSFQETLVDLIQADHKSAFSTEKSQNSDLSEQPSLPLRPDTTLDTDAIRPDTTTNPDCETIQSAEFDTYAIAYRQMALDTAFDIIDKSLSLRHKLATTLRKHPLIIDLCEANLAGLTFPKSASRCTKSRVKLILQKADCTGTDLSALTLLRVNFDGAILRKANMRGLKLRQCNFDRVDASFADLSITTLDKCQARRAVFTQATMTSCTFRSSVLNGSDLRGAILDDTRCYASALALCNLTRASLKRCEFKSSDLRGSVFQGASLNSATIKEVRLQRADMRQIELHDSIFEDSCLCDAVLHEAAWLPHRSSAKELDNDHPTRLLPGIPAKKRCTISWQQVIGDCTMTTSALSAALATSQLCKDLPQDQRDHFVAVLMQLHDLGKTPSPNTPICSIVSPCMRGVRAMPRTFNTTHHAVLLDCTDITWLGTNQTEPKQDSPEPSYRWDGKLGPGAP